MIQEFGKDIFAISWYLNKFHNVMFVLLKFISSTTV